MKCHWAIGALNFTEHEAIERRLVAVCFFAVVADKLDLYSAKRKLVKEKRSFYCVVFNKSMYVMRREDSNGSRQLSATVHLPFYFNFRSLDLASPASRVFLRDTLFHVIRKNGNYK